MGGRMITVRQATLADQAAIFDFLRRAYPDRWQYKFPERWEWAYLHNPYLLPEDGLPVWIAVDPQGQVIGQTCALLEPLQVGNRSYRVGWSVDTFLMSAYRGKGIGFALQKANDAAHSIFMSLSMSAANRRIKSMLGSMPLPPVPLFTKILHHEPASVLQTLARRTQLPETILRGLGVHHLTARLLTAREARRARVLSAWLDPAVELTPVDSFGPASDSLWARLSGKFSALIRRDAQYLNWKYDQQPHAVYERVIARRNGEVCGYVVFRRARPPERNAGVILDVFADPDDRALAQTLFAFAAQSLQAQGAGYLQAATSVPSFQQVLEALGFKPIRSATPMIRAEVELPQEGWLLGKGDHDWDQVPLA